MIWKCVGGNALPRVALFGGDRLRVPARYFEAVLDKSLAQRYESNAHLGSLLLSGFPRLSGLLASGRDGLLGLLGDGLALVGRHSCLVVGWV